MKPYFAKELEGKLMLCSRDGKVIGEISSESAWVKDGMDFDKDDCQIGFIYDGKFRLLDTYSTLWNSMADMFLDGVHVVCKVKGPCGHFH